MISYLVVQRSSRMDRQEPEQGKLPHDGKHVIGCLGHVTQVPPEGLDLTANHFR